jgi:hypothetical protein
VQRSGERRTIETGESLAIQKIDVRSGLKLQAVEPPYFFKERNGVAVTAHEKVLSVIDFIAGLRVGKRVGSAPEMIATFE